MAMSRGFRGRKTGCNDRIMTMVFMLFLAAAVLPMCTAQPRPWSTGTVNRWLQPGCDSTSPVQSSTTIVSQSSATITIGSNSGYRETVSTANNQSLGPLWGQQELTPEQWSKVHHGYPEGWFASLFARTLGLLVANDTDKFPVSGSFSAPSGSAADRFLKAAFDVNPTPMRLQGELKLQNPSEFDRTVLCYPPYQIATPALQIAWPGGRELTLVDMRFYIPNWEDDDQTSTHMRLNPAPTPIPPGPAPPFPPSPAPPFPAPTPTPPDSSSSTKSTTVLGVTVTVGVIAAASTGFYLYKKRQGAALGEPCKGLMDTEYESGGEPHYKRFGEPESVSNPTNVQSV